MMKRGLSLLALVLASAISSAQVFYGKYDEIPDLQSGRVPSNARNAGVRVDQKLNDFVPLDMPFKNEKGETVTMKSLLSGRPIILLPIFYECTGICTIELNKLMESLNAMKRAEDQVGKMADVVVFSIDPNETPELAAAKEQTYLELYKRKGTEEHWTFLTGSKENVAKFTDAIGFRYKIDPANGNITHPAALLILTPEGQISKYFLGNEYPQKVVLLALADAAKRVIGERDSAPFFMSCISVDPGTGQITINVMNSIKTAGVITLVSLISLLVIWERRGRRARAEMGGSSPA